MRSKLLSQFSMGMYKHINVFIIASCFLWITISPQTIFAVTPSTPRGPYYMCDLQQGVAYINWYRAAGASSYEFRFDSKTPSWNDSCSRPNEGDACISTTETYVTIPIVPLEQNDWWVHAVNQDGYSPAMDGQNFICEIPLPRRFYYECRNNNTEVALSWQTLGAAERFEVRMDANPDSWNGSCTKPNLGDQCGQTTTNQIIQPIRQGVSYKTWVHSVQKKVWTEAVEGPQIQCGSLPTPTPTPTNTPQPTQTPTFTPTVTPTNTPTATITPTHTPTSTPLPTATLTHAPTPTSIDPTVIPSPTAVGVLTPTPADPGECPRYPEGDANCDDIINKTDFECWKAEYVEGERGAECVKTADFDGQSGVELLDYAIWQVHFIVENAL